MKLYTPLILLAGMLATGAQAQTHMAQPAQPPGAPSMNKAVETWAEQNVLVNPFSGKPLSAEQVQAELEAARLHTQLLEEKLKQTNLSAEMRNVPLRKSVEAAQAETAVRKEGVNQAEIEKALREAQKLANQKPAAATSEKGPQKPLEKAEGATPVAAPAVASAAPKTAQKTAKSSKGAVKVSKTGAAANTTEPTVAAAEPVAQKTVQPVLVSVMTVGSRRSIVLDIEGASMVVPDGGLTPLGPVVVIDETTANIGGRVYTVHGATLPRFISSDVTQVVAQGAITAGTPVGRVIPGMPAAATANQARPAATRVTPPPLVLPQGVGVQPMN